MDTQLSKAPKKYKWKGNRKQKLAMESWLNPASETFGNAYRSWLKAGFSDSYSKNIMNLAPSYISEYLERVDLNQEHIKQGIQRIALETFSESDSRSPADTRLKAFETLAKITGIIDNKNTQVTQINVTPILGGKSVDSENQVEADRTVVEVEPVDKTKD